MLEVGDLSVARAGRTVLARIAFTVAPGEVVVLTGPNGAGKSSLMRAIAGLERPARGLIRWDGKDVGRRPAHAREGIALVPGGRLLAPSLSVDETLRLGAGRMARGRRAALKARVLARFPALAPRLNQPAGTLSGGEAQMLSLARALMSAPRLLLLDEPTQGLSPAAAKAVFDTLRDLRGEGLAMILTDQDSRAALALADRVVSLEAGGGVTAAPPQTALGTETPA